MSGHYPQQAMAKRDEAAIGFPLQSATTSPPPAYQMQPPAQPVMQQPAPAMQQPTQQPQVVIINQQTARYPPGMGVGKNGVPLDEYQVGLCELCHDCTNLCYACFCPCVLGCKVSQRLDENCCYPLFFGMLPMNIRFRSLAGISRPSMCEEACTFVWCPWCSCLRLANEMEEREFSIRRS